MVCPGCGEKNRVEARFCTYCGTSLALRCSICDTELPPGGRFCDSCGSAVDPSIQAAPGAVRDAAIARFDAPSSPREPGLENLATRTSAKHSAAVNAQDVDGLRDGYHPDFVHMDKRKGMGSVLYGPDAMLENIRASVGRGVSFEFRFVAIRGERLGLARQTISVNDFDIEFYFVSEVDADGRSTRITFFDLDDLDAALAELDAWFLEGEGAPYADMVERGQRQREALARGDFAAYRELMDPDMILIDHRPVSLGEVRGADDVIAALKAIVPKRDVRLMVDAYHGLADDRMLLHVTSSGTAEHGGVVGQSHLRIQQYRDGLVVHVELFPVERLEAALARFEELGAR